MSLINKLEQLPSVVKTDKYHSFRCPTPDHIDEHPSAIYYHTSDTWKCFSCGAHGTGDELSTLLLADNNNPDPCDVIDYTCNDVQIQQYINDLFKRDNHQALHYLTNIRGFTTGIIKQFKLGYDVAKDAITIPCYQDGKLVNVIKRFIQDIKPKYTSLKGHKRPLFGADLASLLGGDTIILVEGELDTITSYQLSPSLPCVGLPGINTPTEHVVNFLSTYKRIYLCLDNDTYGDEKTSLYGQLLGRERCFKVTLPTNDLNDLLVKNDNPSQLYETCMREAKRLAEPRTRDWSDGITQALNYLKDGKQKGLTCGVPNLDELFGGFRPGTLTVLTAMPGVGKTTLASYFAYNMATINNVPVQVGSFEQYFPYSTALQIMSFHTQRNIELTTEYDDTKIGELKQSCSKIPNIYWINHNGNFNLNVLEKDITTAYHEHGVRCVILDHLQILVDATDTSQVEKAMLMLTNLKNKLSDIIIILVVQPKRLADGNARLSQRDLKGGASIEATADTILALEKVNHNYFISTLKIRSNAVMVPVGSKSNLKFNKLQFTYEIGPVTEPDSIDDGTTTTIESRGIPYNNLGI